MTTVGRLTTPRLTRITTAAALAVAAFVALTVLMDWVPNPLNPNIARTTASQRLPGTLIHSGIGVGVIIAQLTQRRRLMLLGATWYTVVLLSATLNWWLPYLTGITVGEIDDTTIQEYAANPRLLPTIDNHVIVPDVQHMIIHTSILAACVLGWFAAAGARGMRSASAALR